MTDLTFDAFDEFFRSVNDDRTPFQWQRELLRRVTRSGWPRVIDLPTASGKTAVLEIAVFHLALQAALPPTERRAARRVFFVVDRRVIVDEAYERARRIAERLEDANEGVLASVADRLRHIAGGNVPLATAVLRGGIYREDAWIRNPAQPLIVISTVDQVGSRLFFRGYGVSEYARPVHAGLVGNDALVILDEVHLSEPFRQTLKTLAHYRDRGWRERTDLPDRFAVVAMSATPGVEADFQLPAADRNERTNPILARRLKAHKRARLEQVETGPGDDPREPLAQACAKIARQFLVDDSKARVVAVVVNRVRTARRVFELLGDEAARADAVLLTGRARPIDRDDLVARIRPRVMAGRTRSADDHPLLIVSTQCIEAGANFDFDGLVTEAASLDALRQRFGRLDRLGELETSHAVVVAHREQVGRSAESDPVYGTALRHTWAWLQGVAAGATTRPRAGKRSRREVERSEVDFGASWLPLPSGRDLMDLLTPRSVPPEQAPDALLSASRAPVLLPAHLDAWVQTHPVPQPDPEVALWLHGIETGPPDLNLIWRADLVEADLASPERAIAIVAACPPSSAEAMPVPLHVLRAWLQGEVVDVTDVEGEPGPDAINRHMAGRRSLRWRGDESQVVEPGMLRPGDTIVVPGSYGGADDYGWDPWSKEPVRDLGDRAYFAQRARPLLRLHPRVLRDWLGPGHALLPDAPSPEAVDYPDARDAVRGWLERVVSGEGVPEWARSACREMMSSGFRFFASPSSLVLVGRRRVRSPGDVAAEVTTDDDTSCLTTRVILGDHCRGVRDLARHYAGLCGLPPDVCEDLALAGWLHDVGKADPRFQLWLHRGDRVAFEGSDELLAKSAMPAGDRVAMTRARDLSGYPAGGRHEVQSVALIEGCEAMRARAHDWDLVVHLVASHHGRCRPLPPAVDDARIIDIRLRHDGDDITASNDHGLGRLDRGMADRFWRLVDRYGWYGLAYLEAILRVADWRQSELEMS